MGRLANGKWIYEDLIPKSHGGEFKRQEQKFKGKIESGGKHPAEKDRYHLYVSYACPWAHRSLIMRKLKDLEAYISISVVSPYMLDDGWSFQENFPGVVGDPLFGSTFLKEVYLKADPVFSGKVTVPVLFDKKLNLIVNNESSEVIRILNQAFDDLTGNHEDFYPRELRSEIDRLNEMIYENVNNGVYKTGFAGTQEAYEKNFRALFAALDDLEDHLDGKSYLVGEKLTEADIRLYTTLIRFDPVYFVHFKCNGRLIREFKNLSAYLKRLCAQEAFSSTTFFDHIKTHYYFSHRQINPGQIIPLGPI